MVVVLSLSCLANILSFTLHYTSPSLYSCWPACALQFHGTSCSCCVASVVHDRVLWQCYCHALWGLSLTDVKKTTFFYGLILVPLQLTEWVLLISTIYTHRQLNSNLPVAIYTTSTVHTLQTRRQLTLSMHLFIVCSVQHIQVCCHTAVLWKEETSWVLCAPWHCGWTWLLSNWYYFKRLSLHLLFLLHPLQRSIMRCWLR